MRQIRIASYNIHGCVGIDGRFSPGRIADVIESLDADIVALQEVEDRRHAGGRVSDFLAGRLDMQPHAGPTLRRGDADYGNLLLARHDAMRTRTHDISVAGREPRGAIEVDFDVGGTPLRFFATHLGLAASERARQLRQLLAEFGRDGPVLRVIAGDFNEWRPLAGSHRSLRRVFGRVPTRRTFPTRAPLLALDRIFVSPGAALTELTTETSRAAAVASDHLPLVGTLNRPESSPVQPAT